jgi:signal transduction histidine kinase
MALFPVGAVLLAFGNYSQYGYDAPLWMRLVPLALVCAAVAVRRAAPGWGLAAGIAGLGGDFALGISLPVVFIFTDCLYAFAAYGPRRAMRRLIAAAIGASLAVGALVFALGGGLEGIVTTTALAAVVFVSPAATGVIVRQARERAVLEAERAEQEARLGEVRRHEAVLMERTRMARELHDTVANYLSAIALQATGLQARERLDEATLKRSVAAIRQSSVEGLAELRRIIRLLRTVAADDELASYRLGQLPALIDRMRAAGLDCGLAVAGEERALPGEVETAVFRVVQESLTNALKYGSDARVRLDYGAEKVGIAVENRIHADGAAVPGSGSGLVGMTERVRLLGGSVSAGHRDGCWRVEAAIPLLEEGR